jgi:hypothetical protein
LKYELDQFPYRGFVFDDQYDCHANASRDNCVAHGHGIRILNTGARIGIYLWLSLRASGRRLSQKLGLSSSLVSIRSQLLIYLTCPKAPRSDEGCELARTFAATEAALSLRQSLKGMRQEAASTNVSPSKSNYRENKVIFLERLATRIAVSRPPGLDCHTRHRRGNFAQG